MSEEYRELLEALDRWSLEVAERNPGVIPCKAGCTACCYGPFDITPADAELLREGLAGLGEADRADIRSRGARMLDQIHVLAPDWKAPWDVNALSEEAFDAICHALKEEPCPVLGPDGRCRAYTHRPLVCRMIGIPLYDSDWEEEGGEGDVIDNECPIKEQFPAYAALLPQPFGYDSFLQREGDILEHTPGGPTIIAAIAAEQ